jgi:hypothetical protein
MKKPGQTLNDILLKLGIRNDDEHLEDCCCGGEKTNEQNNDEEDKNYTDDSLEDYIFEEEADKL